ncbi:MAG TPA: efflux RND transporter periplasmic adaptor subunit [Aquabacterium sp.]|nr:efflux RND transporter periplasmic adaptor subunit [Aquabacterium sp.]
MHALNHRRWGAGLAVVAAGASVALWWPATPSLAQKEAGRSAPAVPVKVAIATVQDQALSLSAVGQVQASQQAVVRARIEGLLTEINFTEGQVVRPGQVLARLDDRSLRAQVDQAQAAVRRLQAELALAQLDLKRYQALVAESAISTQQRDQQQAQVAQLQAQLQSQQASLSQAQTQLSYTVITAPFGGRVGLRQVDVGNVVRPSDAQGLVTLVQTQPLVVVFQAPQTRLADVRRAMTQTQGATVTVAEREGGPILAQGRLRATDNVVDAGSGTLKLKAELAPAGDRLWPGQFVTVHLNTGSLAGALTVPIVAVQRGLKGSFVWRVTEGVAQMVPIQVRWQSDVVAAIDVNPQGLKAGDQVVIDGQSRLKPKALVKVLPAGPAVAAASKP